MRAMTLTRRTFMQALGVGTVGAAALRELPLFAARGREAFGDLPPWERDAAFAAQAPLAAIRLNSNENPLGPGEKQIAAIRSAFSQANRYPYAAESAVQDAIARAHKVPKDHVLVGCGSGEILRMAVYAHTGPGRHLVTGAPTFEDPEHHARALGVAVAGVPVDRELRLDLDAMAAKAPGAGLVFLCNPNNPTGTVHGGQAVTDFLARVGRAEPRATVLVDEAYHEYVDDPSYRTMVPVAVENPRVIVSRTFSKVFGMAGMRIGYAIGRPETLAAMRKFKLGNAVNVLAAAGAAAGLEDSSHIAAETARNRDVRQFTRDAIAKLGYTVAPSQTNFVMIDVRCDAKDIIEGCKKQNVLIGRPFPPLTTWARVSIGTADEMRRAIDVLARVLRSSTGD
jgi:histidinol-phosphate aminotransferase